MGLAGRRRQRLRPLPPPLELSGCVTALEPEGRRGRTRLYLDDAFAFSLSSDLAATLQVGRVLSVEDAVALQERDRYQRALDLALTFLGYRPRSEHEVRARLARAGYDEATASRVIARLQELRLVDDQAFASFWVQQRQRHSPRGELLLRKELREKGADGAAVAAALAEAEQGEEAAYAAGRRKARQSRLLDRATFRQRVGSYLARRGFTWDVIAPALERLWAARNAE